MLSIIFLSWLPVLLSWASIPPLEQNFQKWIFLEVGSGCISEMDLISAYIQTVWPQLFQWLREGMAGCSVHRCPYNFLFPSFLETLLSILLDQDCPFPRSVQHSPDSNPEPWIRYQYWLLRSVAFNKVITLHDSTLPYGYWYIPYSWASHRIGWNK